MSGFETLCFDTPGAWAQAGEGRFVPASPDTLLSEGGPGMLWYTPEELSDFELLVDWRTSSPEDNSGVFLRFPLAELARREPDWKAGHGVLLNGVEVCRHTASEQKSRAGRLGLQNHHEGSRVFFRAPRLLRLKQAPVQG